MHFASLIVAKVLGWFQRLFGSRTRPQTGSEFEFEALVWMEADENPFGVKVLDCRPLGDSLRSLTTDPRSVQFFGSPDARSGEVFQGMVPDPAITVPCDLLFPLSAPLPNGGPLFLASVMEEKWNVYHFADVLYFVRSWNGELRYTVGVTVSEAGLHVSEVRALRTHLYAEGSLVLRQIDYLIRCCILGEITPHPVPLFCVSKQAIAVWTFSEYGRLGHFAEPFQG